MKKALWIVSAFILVCLAKGEDRGVVGFFIDVAALVLFTGVPSWFPKLFAGLTPKRSPFAAHFDECVAPFLESGGSGEIGIQHMRARFILLQMKKARSSCRAFSSCRYAD